MVSGPLPLAIWRSSLLTGDGFLVGEALALALVGERRRSIAPATVRSAYKQSAQSTTRGTRLVHVRIQSKLLR